MSLDTDAIDPVRLPNDLETVVGSRIKEKQERMNVCRVGKHGSFFADVTCSDLIFGLVDDSNQAIQWVVCLQFPLLLGDLVIVLYE